MKLLSAISFLLLFSQNGLAQESGLGIVGNYRQNCTVAPLNGEAPIFENYTKAQMEIAKFELLEQPPKADLLRKKEILESQANLAKSKCLIRQIIGSVGDQIKAKDFEKRSEMRSLLSQLSMYQGMANRALQQFQDTEHCLSGTMQQRLKCTEETHKKHAHDQTAYNAVEFFMDIYPLALKRNPDLTIADLGKAMEKRFDSDIKYLKSLPEPGEEGEDETGDSETPPAPDIDELIPSRGVR